MTNITNKIHLGVYGLCVQGDKVLVIKKSRGAYTGLFDSPGGRLEFGESLEDCLRREYQEEVGVGATSLKFFGVFEYQCEYLKNKVMTPLHHVGIYYLVNIDSLDIKKDADGHDSLGAEFVDINNLNENNVSGIFYLVLESFLNKR